MAFHFTLEVLLRVRQSLERQQELLLLEANQRLASLGRQIEDLEAQMAWYRAREREQLQSGMRGAELQFDLLCLSQMQARRRALATEMVQAEAKREARRRALREARQQREVVETVRHHQLQGHRQQEARAEQRRLDEMFLLRQAYLRRS